MIGSCRLFSPQRSTVLQVVPMVISSAVRTSIQSACGRKTISSSHLATSHLFAAAPALAGSVRFHSDNTGQRDRPLTLHVQLPCGTVRTVTAYEGQTLLDVASEHGLPIEGACGGSCACSTCHIYLENDASMGLFAEASDEENDMLDMAFFPQPTSRLGCQLTLKQDRHDGLKITLPKATRNMYVDGHTVTPHH
ncbi:2Fe 2S iron sulfur cluster binding domain [Trypanosoma vivax]|uniref:Putative electron transfer protein n=1 Tax=Trypanosoma vivax (strain Y486) TaxID=1055687 RepID=G0TXN5_TRYVY|nr:2Fe 2S iron sulfur cluster binding domain [Trypanosoma vivax]CCC48726.1 putative electron transfer protein [Trypanosoma vivax Y486]